LENTAIINIDYYSLITFKYILGGRLMNDKLLNVKEISEYLNVSKSSVYNYIKDESIPSIKLNGRLLFSQDAINSWIKKKKREAKK
jgi:excisionase family DNA binding protein